MVGLDPTISETSALLSGDSRDKPENDVCHAPKFRLRQPLRRGCEPYAASAARRWAFSIASSIEPTM